MIPLCPRCVHWATTVLRTVFRRWLPTGRLFEGPKRVVDIYHFSLRQIVCVWNFVKIQIHHGDAGVAGGWSARSPKMQSVALTRCLEQAPLLFVVLHLFFFFVFLFLYISAVLFSAFFLLCVLGRLFFAPEPYSILCAGFWDWGSRLFLVSGVRNQGLGFWCLVLRLGFGV